MTSYFMYIKESTTYYPWDIERMGNDLLHIEMYNFTNIYIIPQDPDRDIKFSFTFKVLQVDPYRFGDKY